MLKRSLAVLAFAFASLFALTPGLVAAQTQNAAADIGLLGDTLLMDQVVTVMRDEGIEYGTTLEEEMFPGRGGDDWTGVVSKIYDTAQMRARFDTQLTKELQDAPDAVSDSLRFFTSPQGKRILALELEARRMLTDDAAEEAAKVAVEDMIADSDPRMQVLRDFAEANALIEMNVTGALNANLAFYKGMDEGGAFGGEMTEDQMLSDVWEQEPEVRAQTEEWVYSFLALAYAPLSEADLAAYQAFSESPSGQKVNAALFAAYDSVFTPISRDLGRAAARQMQGEDI
jgi:hypothetical protein